MSDIYQAPEAPLNEPIPQGQYGSLERALAGNYELKPIEIFKSAWANLSGMKGTFWGAVAILYLIAIVLAGLFVFFLTRSITAGIQEPSSMIALQFVFQIIQTVVTLPMSMGLAMIALKHSVGANIQFSEIFKHFNKTLPLLFTYILMIICITIGLILLVLPGIYLMLAYSMAMMLVIEKDMSPWEALETSRKALSKKWFSMLGFMSIALVVLILGALALLVGIIWALPLTALAYATVYRDIFGVEAKTLKT